MIDFKCIEEITEELKKEYKGIQANEHGYCCTSCYDIGHKYINSNDYVCAKIYKDGTNNQYFYDEDMGEYVFKLNDKVYFLWKLTNFKLDDVIETMQKIANKYNYVVEYPEEDFSCIVLREKGD